MADGRNDQYLITASVAGVPLGIYDKHKGGDTDSPEKKYRGGGMGPQVSLGGQPEVSNVTITRLYDRDRDVDLVRWLRTQIGQPMSVSRQPLDANKNPKGRPDVFTGKLKKVSPTDVDSEGNAPDTYDLELSTEGTIA